jgi:hypothetical protein
MPMDEWMLVADSRPLSFTMADGSKAQLEKDAVFRISVDGGQPVVYMLHGNGEIDAGKLSTEVFVRAGETGFSAAPGARIKLQCTADGEFDPAQVRAWSRPQMVNAQVVSGDVVLKSEQQGFYFVPLRDGEKVEWKRGDFRVFEADGNELGLPTKAMRWTEGFGQGMDEAELMQIQLLFRKELRSLEPRMNEFKQRLEKAKGEHPRYKADIDRQMKELDRVLESLQVEVVVGGDDVIFFQIGDESMTVSTDGETVKVTVSGKTTGSVTYRANSPEAVRELMPEHLKEYFDGIDFERDADGRLNMNGAHAEAHSNGAERVKVKIIKEAHSDD